ncbi:hypothetical protein F3Y22_tig00113726pilonHSYRG00402 [Hibiscus syriacus]|uniref:Uncharacterized protein n=1 Tax=Hibiscus syriacus TaxID=106335 RepID=A0A6A2Y147_HIBSY|nr:hypothetical protein F3Y22_tig00113726pilonHSYRG00402 [Hibiscus syriacus]
MDEDKEYYMDLHVGGKFVRDPYVRYGDGVDDWSFERSDGDYVQVVAKVEDSLEGDENVVEVTVVIEGGLEGDGDVVESAAATEGGLKGDGDGDVTKGGLDDDEENDSEEVYRNVASDTENETEIHVEGVS